MAYVSPRSVRIKQSLKEKLDLVVPRGQRSQFVRKAIQTCLEAGAPKFKRSLRGSRAEGVTTIQILLTHELDVKVRKYARNDLLSVFTEMAIEQALKALVPAKA